MRARIWCFAPGCISMITEDQPGGAAHALCALLPLTWHAESFQPGPLTPTGKIPPRFAGEITTDFKRRTSGERIKHRINNNSIKSYGKAHTPAGDVFRVGTTTNQIADLHRRTEISQKANERYLNALSVMDDTTRLSELIRTLEKPCGTGKQRVRALHPFSAEDHALFEALVVNPDRRKRLFCLCLMAVGGPQAHPVEGGSPDPTRRRSVIIRFGGQQGHGELLCSGGLSTPTRSAAGRAIGKMVQPNKVYNCQLPCLLSIIVIPVPSAILKLPRCPTVLR